MLFDAEDLACVGPCASFYFLYLCHHVNYYIMPAGSHKVMIKLVSHC